MTIVRSWDGAGLAAGNLTTASVGTGDSAWSAVGSVPTIIVEGTQRKISVANTTTAHQFRWASQDLAAWQASWTFECRTASATASGVPILYANTMAGALLCKIALGSTDTFSLVDGLNAVVSTSSTFTKGVEYDFEVWGDTSGGLHVRAYTKSTNVLFWTKDASAGVTGNLKDIIFGRQSGAAYGPGIFYGFKLGNVAAAINTHLGTPFGRVLMPDLVTTKNIYLRGRLASDLVTVIPMSTLITKYVGGTVPPATLRDPFLLPGAVTTPFLIPLSTTASYELATDAKTASFISQAGNVSGKLGQVNSSTFSIATAKATTADPQVTVTNLNTGTVLAPTIPIRIPTAFVPAAGTDNAGYVQQPPDGSGNLLAYDFYRLKKVDNTHWTCTAWDVSDPRGEQITAGIRASNVSARQGLITSEEVNAEVIPHALAMSIPKEYLKLTPTGADGQVVNGKAVWPANSQDTQATIPYTGIIPMGTLFAIHSSVNIAGLGLTGPSLALAYALQRYGVYVLDQSTTFAIYVSPTANATKAAAMKTAWRATLLGLCRRVTTNTSTNRGGGPAPRLAADPAPIA